MQQQCLSLLLLYSKWLRWVVGAFVPHDWPKSHPTIGQNRRAAWRPFGELWAQTGTVPAPRCPIRHHKILSQHWVLKWSYGWKLLRSTLLSYLLPSLHLLHVLPTSCHPFWVDASVFWALHPLLALHFPCSKKMWKKQKNYKKINDTNQQQK